MNNQENRQGVERPLLASPNGEIPETPRLGLTSMIEGRFASAPPLPTPPRPHFRRGAEHHRDPYPIPPRPDRKPSYVPPADGPGRGGREDGPSSWELLVLRIEYLADHGSTVAAEILSADPLNKGRAKGLFKKLNESPRFSSPALVLECDKCDHQEFYWPREDRDRCPVLAGDRTRCRGLLWPPSDVMTERSHLSILSHLSRLHATTRNLFWVASASGPEFTTAKLREVAGMPRSTLHRHLDVLKQEGFLVQARQGHWRISHPRA
jgi:hypothetical protein